MIRVSLISVLSDAVCIDQENVPEVNDQVQRMKTTYLQASEVVVWLGEEDQGDSKAIQLLVDVHQRSDDPAWRNGVATDPETPKAIEALAGIFRCDHWSRSWVVQEIIF